MESVQLRLRGFYYRIKDTNGDLSDSREGDQCRGEGRLSFIQVTELLVL